MEGWIHSVGTQPTAQPYRLPQLKSGLIYSTLTPDRWSYGEISWRHLYFFSIHLSSFTFKPWPTKAYSQLLSKFKRSKNTEKCNQCHTSSLSSTKFGLLVLAQSRQANSTKTIHWLFPPSDNLCRLKIKPNAVPLMTTTLAQKVNKCRLQMLKWPKLQHLKAVNNLSFSWVNF